MSPVPLTRAVAALAFVLAGAGTVLLITLGAPAALAADDPREVNGRALFTQGEYQKALEVFSTLYAEKADPLYLRNIGRCHQQLRSPGPAIDAFRGYLRRGRNLRAGERAEIEGYIREMEALAEEQRKTREAEAARASAATAEETGPRLPPAARPAEAPAGHSAPSVLATERAPVADGPGLLSRWWFWAGVVGVVAAGTATALVLANRNNPPPRAMCPQGVICSLRMD